jgi:diguanylate cyclase (GGDEF)-like protein
MQRQLLLTSPGKLRWRSHPEFSQGLARAAIVSGALWFAFSPYFAAHAPVAVVGVARIAAMISAAIAALLLASIIRWPAPSMLRRLAGITHDVSANSIAMFLGGEVTAFFAVIYVVIILGSGVRFGAAYMGYASLLSLLGFGAIHLFSSYWETNSPLSINVVLVLTVVPAYMYPLIRSRQYAREELEQRATHDSLTGLMNRAGLEQQLELLVTPRAPGQALIYFDLDRFKAVNDVAGHAAGDKLLAHVADIMRDCVRGQDICARIGGDEFCVFLRECPLPLGAQIATRLRERIHEFQMSWEGRKFSVGASLGVVSSQSAEDGPSFMRLADAACYAAKNAGRNTIHVVGADQSRVDTGKIRALHLTQ